MTEPNKQPIGRGRYWGVLRFFPDLPLWPVLVKACLCVQIGPLCMYLGPAEAAKKCELKKALKISQDQPQTATEDTISLQSAFST